MSQHKWLGAVFIIALSSATTGAFAIEGAGGADRDRAHGSNWDQDTRNYEDRGGYYYQDDNLRARHQRLRDDEAERRYETDFDTQSRMNN